MSAITYPGDSVVAVASGVLDIADDVLVEEADALQCPSLRTSYQGLLASRALRNPDRSICRGLVGRGPA